MSKKDFRAIATKLKYNIANKNSCIWKSETSLYSIEKGATVCPKCNSKLDDEEVRIPVNTTEVAIVSGLYCKSCHKCYVYNSKKIKEVLSDNPFADKFTLNGKPLYNITYLKKLQHKKQLKQKKKQKLSLLKSFVSIIASYALKQKLSLLNSVESSVVLINIQFDDKTEKNIIIVNDKNKSNSKNGIYHYLDVEGREILTAAFCESRRRKGCLNENKFDVLETVENTSFRKEPNKIYPVYLRLGNKGGFSSSVINKQFEIVHMLLYSPFTNRYEIMKATYDKDKNESFVDAALYRNFVKKYGKPDVEIGIDTRYDYNWYKNLGGYDYNKHKSWDELNPEPFLKIYGYSVSEKNNMTAIERHDLLAEIVDLEILTPAKIIKHLDFVIITHSSPKD
ncbi:MAG: hypothetical protein LUF33_05235, partial [Clostridiales bacterium]|nr:hypothetical protein [Clostridiales bacterium]